MTISFNTYHINERLYTRAIRYYLYELLGAREAVYFLRHWDIDIYPSDKASEDPFFHGQDGVGGVTGNGKIKLYIEDKLTLTGDIFQRAFRKNMVVISHEICHAVLLHKGKTQRVKLRNDDYSGHRAGTVLNYSTAEVHDRHTEGNFYTMNFWFWDWELFIPRKMTCRVLDIRDIV